MKKIYIIIFNILMIFLILLGFEFYLYKKFPNNINIPFLCFTNRFETNRFDNIYKDLKFRCPIFKNNNKKPVVIFGCSFGFGERLKKEQTFHYKLSNLLNRTVYNRAITAAGIQHMLYQLKREDFYKEIPEPEYIIYVFISNHIQRMYKYNYGDVTSGNYHYLKYNNIKNTLKEEYRMNNIPYSRIVNYTILPPIAKIKEDNGKNTFNLMEQHFLEAKKEVEKHWGNTKFIIFDYESEDDFFNSNKDILNKANVRKLENDGFIVIKSSDLTDIKLGEEYYLNDIDHHPNEAAWDLLTPLFVERIKYINN